MSTHAIERTNAKGVPMIGRCIRCGATGLKAEDALKPCPNTLGISDEQAVVLAVLGPEERTATGDQKGEQSGKP